MFNKLLSKGKIMLLSTLCMLSLISIGFASWMITPTLETEEVDGGIETEKVVNSASYISLNNEKYENGIDAFRYYEYGFLSSDNYWSRIGTMRVYFTVDVLKCKEIFGEDCNSLEVSLNLKYVTSSTFKLMENLKNEVTISIFKSNELNTIDSNIDADAEGSIIDNPSIYHSSVITFTNFNTETYSVDKFIFCIEYSTKSIIEIYNSVQTSDDAKITDSDDSFDTVIANYFNDNIYSYLPLIEFQVEANITSTN